MKILIVSTLDIQGGAARAAYRLHKSLLNQDVDSQMLVQNKSCDDFSIITEDKKIKNYFNKLRPIIDSIPIRFYKERNRVLFSSSWLGFSNIVDKINEIDPDIVHFHWICGGMIKIEDIARIKAPIVWSLHDMWAFTGGCHYSGNCNSYISNCGNCKILRSNKENDLSRKIFCRKKKTFLKTHNMTIVGLSKWISKCSMNSTLLKDKKLINLPNPMNTAIYKQFDREEARRLWNLPKDKKLILFGAMGATSDPRKGFKLLNKAISKLTYNDLEFVIFGSNKPKESQRFGYKTHYLGNLQDDISLVTLYSAVDVMVVPSIQENLSNAIMESLSCGTPVVAFNIGGNSDMIEHQKNGFLAEPYSTKSLSDGIDWVLNNQNYCELCKSAREKVVREFDSIIVAQKYIKLYKEILAG